MSEKDKSKATTSAEIGDRLTKLFLPDLQQKRDDFINSSRQFVHYTSGANALSIIRNKEFWLRSTVCMNDYSEIQHGRDLLLRGFDQNEGRLFKAFRDSLNKAHNGIAVKAFELFDQHFAHNKYRVFVGCLSEHDPANRMGRLSMWRAYGGASTPVALVLNKRDLFIGSDTTNIYMSPVIYVSDSEIEKTIEKIIKGIEENLDFLKSIPPGTLILAVSIMLLFLVICLKHPGFSEEQEWRLIHMPIVAPSPIAIEAIETVNGVPQHVYKIPLKDWPDHNVVGIGIPDLLQSLIVGPTQFPFPVLAAFEKALTDEGVSDSGSKVFAAMIPLRT